MENTNKQLILEKLPFKNQLVVNKDYGKLYLLEDLRIIVCELSAEYVPIERFQEIFHAAAPLIQKYKIEKFVFDKQQLKIFHQASMEWYFLIWKKDMYEYGLKKYRKILPQNNPSFAFAVEAGKAKIMRENKDTIIPLLDIQYCTNLKDAIEN